ncbi:hypothetical protein JAAARDRAFT_28179 [Jaapia argillacea MUCL 33604]|uniref:Patatin-like phospholipase domain-containing protein n=1 Tax=Jaapia argillacea MUCL 33604 TaxID=933084 RepID=A0A067QC63_9AGAM|nr:hypothetical protein JAAARDRAFT_28179 [Jaapia argillacea MUCL 33604]
MPQNASHASIASVEDEFTVDFVNESHMQSFAEALASEDLVDTHQVASPGSHSGALTPRGERVRKVSALSDFAPVNLKVSRRRRGDKVHERRPDWLFLILRWPLLLLIFLFISVEFGFYVLIRQLVNAKEWVSAWRGRKGLLRKRLRGARNYQEWKDAATTLDEYMHFNEWKTVDEDPFYDWRLVRKVRRSLRNLREKNDVRGVLGVLETCIRTNFAGIESSRLYSETFFGTKTLIEEYITEQETAFQYIRDSISLSNEEKRRFFKTANTNLGTSALCLSGGASFGYYHVGVVKAFLDADLLPRVITGTSAGGLIAALACTRTDAELKHLLVPELAHRITACEEPFPVWFKRFLNTGARFDSLAWARKACFFTRGSLTFKEAYIKTGRALNISVIPADRHSPTKLLNYMTAPDTVIWSALLASAAVPGILNPVVLMQKLKDGRIVPWNWGSKFKDGSLRVDIPLQSLNLYFNVTHPVVSQVNPHVHLFFFAPRGSAGKPVAHSKGKGWRGNFLLSAAEQWLKLELTKNFKVIRDLELLPQILGQDWSSVFLQRFEGAVTIWPRTRFMDWIRILSDPDPAELERMIRVGQMVTWPKLHMIENRSRLEKQIYIGRQSVRRSVQSNRDRERAALQVRKAEKQDAVSLDTTGTRPPQIDIISPVLPASISNEMPLAVDTDAEAAFTNRSARFFKRTRHPPSPRAISTPPDLGTVQDPLASPSARRRWATELFEERNGATDASSRVPTPDPPPDTSTCVSPIPKPSSPPSPSSLFARLKSPSFPILTSPFATMRRREKEREEATRKDSTPEDVYPTDSSSDDDFSVGGRRPTRPPSILNFANDFSRVDRGGIDDSRGDAADDDY